jgi:hypothetical protein
VNGPAERVARFAAARFERAADVASLV